MEAIAIGHPSAPRPWVAIIEIVNLQEVRDSTLTGWVRIVRRAGEYRIVPSPASVAV